METTLTTAKSYFAIQTYPGETLDELARYILTTAKAAGLRFRGLEYIGPETFGTTAYSRFRSDMEDATPLVDKLRMSGRGVIGCKPGAGFMITTPDGRHGFVPGSRMLASPRQNRVYRGTALKLCMEQFSAS